MKAKAVKFWAIIATFLLFGCQKDGETPSTEPTISLLDITPTTVVQFDNHVKVKLKYEDYDGDLGFPNPDQYALQIRDNRLSAYDEYHVPPQAPIGEDLYIEGELEVELNTLFLLGNGSEEVTSFTIRIRDRAGNWSNELSTPFVTIKDSI